MLLSILCIVNNADIFEGFTESLEMQEFRDYELIPVWNLENSLKGAGPAFNDAAAGAAGKYIAFAHPDIRFSDEKALGDIMAFLEDVYASESAKAGAAGVAGADENARGGRDIFTNIVHGSSKQPAGMEIDGPRQVQTLDECFFAVEKEYFFAHPFPSRDGWHLYGAEYCLNAILNGRKNYVVPARLWHLSDGKSLDAEYVRQAEALIKDKKEDFPLICTTVKAWKTKGAGAALYRKYYYVKQKIKRLILRG
ncbi:MAG: glycosyltransferase [Lachnospiraceae bacterium]